MRLIKVLLSARFGTALGVLDVSVIRLRVWPNDLDFNLHMNNGRYLTIMDLGRIDLMARNGSLKTFRQRRWMPVVAAQTITFRRSLRPLQEFELHTRVVCWDEDFVYMEQTFMAEGRIAALALVRAAFVEEGRKLHSADVLEAIGVHRRSPSMPSGIKAWTAVEDWHRETSSADVRQREALAQGETPDEG
ncbi:thioesterase [Pelagibius litoralis]|uniref:Thioesterase n=1 Tax=Pelagibius litoralis TaxID=374515 RepID=A0A967F0B4_9PROT|nr:thioesterase family protein [Pelagibius litoralis]NIA70788.1 thioesterase [Pelagibius litoralis]